MLSTFSDRYAALALGVGLTALCLTLLLLSGIVYLRVSLRRNQRREQHFTALWRPLLLEAISEASPTAAAVALPMLHARDQVFFLKLWNYLQASLRGSANDRLNELAYRLGCDATARRLLRRGGRSEHLLACVMLGHLRDPTSWEALADQAGKRDSVASLHAARAMLKIDPLRATDRLMPLLLSRRDWAITQVAAVLSDAREAFGQRLASGIFTLDLQHWPRALALADALRLALPLQAILLALKPERSVDALVAALHLASGVALLPTVRTYLPHTDWRVRAEAVRFLGSFGDEDDIGPLQVLLDDQNWGVRYQAAQALASMPFVGLPALQAMREQPGGTRATAALDHVLAERQVHAA